MSQQQDHSQVDAYLDAVCGKIACREVHPEIRRELESHILDRVDAEVAQGCPRNDALARALAHMGEAAEVGRRLHASHRPRTEWGLLAATALLVLLGLWAMYAVEASGSTDQGSGLLVKKLLYTAAGLSLGGLLYLADYRYLRQIAWPLYGLTFAATAYLTLFGNVVNGLPRYIDLTPLLFTPALAGLFASWNWKHRWTWVKFLVVLGAPLPFYIMVPYPFAAAEFLACLTAVLITVRPGRWYLGGAALAIMSMGGATIALLLKVPSRWERFLTWLDPARDPQGAGYQVIQAQKAMSEAGLWGEGPTAPLPLVPEVHSSSVFPSLVHSLGWVAGAAICLLVLFFLFRLVTVARRSRGRLGQALAAGIAASFALRSLWHIGMFVGLAPAVGVDLPFISHGGRQMLYLAVAGLALGVFRRKDMVAGTNQA